MRRAAPTLPPPARLLALAAALALPLAACRSGDDARVARWETVVDTIGDTVVVRTVGATDSAALARLVPELRIGEFEGADEYTFAAVAMMAPAPGGGVYVWDQTTAQLRQYDSTGRHVRDVGRKGEGPGEYDALNGFGVLPDGRVVAWDARHNRVNVYDTTGTFVTAWRLPSNFFTSNGVVVDTAGSVYVLQILDPWDATQPDRKRRQGYVRIAAGDPERRDSLPAPDLGVEPAVLTAVRRDGTSTASTMTSVPFQPGVFWQMSPHGYFVTATGDRMSVLLHRPEGPLRMERDVPAVRLDADERANAEERATSVMRRTDPAWRWSGPAVPQTKPAITSLRVDADGRIWARRSMPGERIPEDEIETPRPGPQALVPLRWREPTAFDVFAPDGRYLGFVSLPPRTTLLHMRGDRAWGVERDSLDVPYVTRYRIEWTGRGAR